MEADELSDLELLASGLQEAVEAYRAGVIIGPALDVVALKRATRRAFRQDVAQALRTAVAGDVA